MMITRTSSMLTVILFVAAMLTMMMMMMMMIMMMMMGSTCRHAATPLRSHLLCLKSALVVPPFDGLKVCRLTDAVNQTILDRLHEALCPVRIKKCFN